MTSTPPRTIHVPSEPRRRRTRIALIVGGGALLLVVAVVGAIALGVTTAGNLRAAPDSETVPGVRELVVDVEDGRVSLTAATGPDVEVRTTRVSRPGYEPVVERDLTDGVLTLRSDCPSFNLGCEVEQEIAVPAGTVVAVRTVGGPVEAVGLDVPRFSAVGVGGAITAGFVRPPDDVRVESVSGAVRIDVPPGPYRVSTDSVSGPVTVDLATDPSAERAISVDTVSGPIAVSPR